MANIIVAPELPKVIVYRRGVFSVPVEHGLVGCSCSQRVEMLTDEARNCVGWRIGQLPLPARLLELEALRLGWRFIERMRVRGYEPLGEDASLRLHGPWLSYNFDDTLNDVDSSVFRDAERPDKWGDAHPEKVLGFVQNAPSAIEEKFDYLLIGAFLRPFERIEGVELAWEDTARIRKLGLHGLPKEVSDGTA